MKDLDLNVQRVSIRVPDDFGRWNNIRQINFVQDKLENISLTIIKFKLRSGDENE